VFEPATDAQGDRKQDFAERVRVYQRNLRLAILSRTAATREQQVTTQRDVDQQLTVFLRERRRGIDRNIRVLGDFPRPRTRWGMRVTQEELAEALGVSRVWYSTFESGAGIRVSVKLLKRVAVVLMLDEWERVALYGLALPELRAAFADLFSQFPEALVKNHTVISDDETALGA
jgi:DNA-binding XRE family transcriptional regulator